MAHQVIPTVRLIGFTALDRQALLDYLLEVEDEHPAEDGMPWAVDWMAAHDGVSDINLLIEAMGRLCYRSWEPRLNPNVTRVRQSTNDYIRNILDVDHGSVLEHATFNFIFSHVSRVFTHELVRHRVGTAISQESMRYVRPTDIPLWFPGNVVPDEHVHMFAADMDRLLNETEQWYARWSTLLDLDNPNMPFVKKKEATSALRRLVPDGIATSIGWSANVRTLRHTIAMRTAQTAEVEIRMVFDKLAGLVNDRWPVLLSDFKRLGDGTWQRTTSV